MNHTEIINLLIDKFGYDSYLEIGVQDSRNNFDLIKCGRKQGVDPEPYFKTDEIFVGTSDEYFSRDNLDLFDIIFIDGDHNCRQVYRDIVNSLRILSEGGTIVCHDMNPEKEIIQRVPRVTKEWTGDSWKAWQAIYPKIDNSFVIDTDYGVGIIKPEWFEWICKPAKLKEEMINKDYQYLESNRKEILNLKSVEEFEKWLS